MLKMFLKYFDLIFAVLTWQMIDRKHVKASKIYNSENSIKGD